MPNAPIDLLLRKGVYPYEYMSSFSKFDETSLPPREAFFSTLTQQHIAEEDYAHAQKVWKKFNINNMGEYHDLYVQSDVLQLADVFQNFRLLCSQYYSLDCAHFLTAPGLAWEASLQMCKQPLELLRDNDMHLLIERGIRGGVSMISQRWACANNLSVPNPDPAKPTSYIMYYDANNLYGHSMSEPLPYEEFQWVNPDVDSEWIMSLDDFGTHGYIFEVDLEYPSHIHDLHSCYPLAADKIKITKDMLSPYSLKLIENMPYVATEKLVPNLLNKSKYVVFFRNLKYYLSLGMKLQHVHRILKFKQKAWLKPYIEFNTEQRKQSSTSFEKNFFKLMNNSVYGKTMESVRRRVDIQLVNSEKKANKLVASPLFTSFKIFDENLVGVQRKKASVTLNKPLYVGFVVLELSKLHMYKFHYDYMKCTYGEKAHLLFTDTDSLTYHIETPDIYADMALHPELFDTSDYPQDHPLYSTENKKKIGCFKDELNSKPVYEFVGLRAKMYSLLSSEGEKKTAKGVSRSVVKRKITHENYKDVLFDSKLTREIQYRIQSDHHQIFTIKQSKVALSPLDDKRYIDDDGIHTRPHGHYKNKR